MAGHPQVCNIFDIKFNLKQNINTNGAGILGCDVLPDGTMVFSDYHVSKECLIIIDGECKHLYKVSMEPCYAFDVTCLDDTTVAVTSSKSSHSGVNIVDVRSRKIVKFLERDFPCYGITTLRGSLLYCAEGRGIKMMNVSAKSTTTIVKCNLPDWSFVAAYNDKLYYTNYYTHTVTCSDMNGNTLWTFADENVLRSPQGISVDDKYGHVYVSNECTSVVLLSGDGQHSRLVLSTYDGLVYPVGIHYDRMSKQLFIANAEDNVLIFEVSP